MALNSVNTNLGAQVALAALNSTQDQLTATQKRISTGYRVSDATDDGAAFAVAQRVRGDVAATTAANETLGGVKGLLDTTNAALTGISNTLNDLNSTMEKLASGTLSSTEQSNYSTQVNETVKQIQSYIEGANYNGINIINDKTTASTGSDDDGVAVNGGYTETNSVTISSDGSSYTFDSAKMTTGVFDQINTLAKTISDNAVYVSGDKTAIAAAYNKAGGYAEGDDGYATADDIASKLADKYNTDNDADITADPPTKTTQTADTIMATLAKDAKAAIVKAAGDAIGSGGTLTTAISTTSTALNKNGAYSNRIDSQISFNQSIMDAQNSGLGALVDADLAKESANLQALQIRQQLGTQALSIANQAPQALLKLFG